MKFVLDDATQRPLGVAVAVIKEANNLVEEFMLLANMAVAHKVEKHFPKTALLRRHPPPKLKVLKEVMEQCELLGFPIDGTSSGMLSKALRRFEGKSETQVRSFFTKFSADNDKPGALYVAHEADATGVVLLHVECEKSS